MNGRTKITVIMGLLAAMLASGAVAQTKLGSDSDAFLNAIRDQDATKATDIVRRQGKSVTNYRGHGGETPLTVATANRSILYVGFLIGNGAEPDFSNQRGDTPLIIASRGGFVEAVQLLIEAKAKIGLANRQGESPLIAAVQGRHIRVVKMLLETGATADTTDFSAGFSARDYARRDTRNPELLRLIETIKPARKIIAGPTR
ncbi:MAG: ankyrin repeat domain-containing protein [Sphingomonas bacterium]|nr:ankyrin repeat domain-containing protein [Sphingomonas bacterium]